MGYQIERGLFFLMLEGIWATRQPEHRGLQAECLSPIQIRTKRYKKIRDARHKEKQGQDIVVGVAENAEALRI